MRGRTAVMLVIGFVLVLCWQTRIGSLALYPFSILGTWFHEMGHGLAALLTGGRFERLVIYPDGSGYALSSYPSGQGRLGGAFVAAAGPLAPAMAGAVLIMATRTPERTRLALKLLGAALIVTTVIWVRSLVGWLVLPALGLAVLVLARRAGSTTQGVAVRALGLVAAASAWRSFDYLFSAGGTVGGRTMRSDTGVIADLLFLPYWVWGAVISVLTAAMLWASFRYATGR